VRALLCWLLTGHTPERIEWQSLGQADRLVTKCLRCGHTAPIPVHEYRERSRRDFGW
jgi:hypothetical protein